MKKLLMFIILLLSLCTVSCSHEKEEDMGQLAAIAAKGYYDELLQGKYEEFVDATYRRDSIPAVYREQLIANAKMYIGQQNVEHQGIKEVTIANAKADTARRTAQVFLVLNYGDKSNEQIVVPMIQYQGIWKMR